MGRILLKNILVGERGCDILIDGNLIESITASGSEQASADDVAGSRDGVSVDVVTGSRKGASAENAGAVEVVDCSGMAALPGLINMHTHAAMTLFRGVGEDIDFSQWIDRIWEIEKDIDDEFIYWATKVACVEMIKTGTTAFYDQYWRVPEARKAVEEMGLRAMLSYVHLDHYDKTKMQIQKQECEALWQDSLSWPERLGFAVAIHSVYSVSAELIQWAAAFARERGLKINIHLCETEKEVKDCIAEHGLSPVKYLDFLGVLDPDVTAAHTLWVDEDDIRILAERGVTCVHNINSNLKLASGYRFKYNEMRDAGVNLCIGTDGCASSNNLDMLEAMKTAALVQKAWRNDPQAMPLDELLAMATSNAAQSLGMNTGRLKEGCLADILIVDMNSSFFLSKAPFLANFIYSAHSDSIDSVICDGKFLMRHRKVEGEEEILSAAQKLLLKR